MLQTCETKRRFSPYLKTLKTYHKDEIKAYNKILRSLLQINELDWLKIKPIKIDEEPISLI